MNRLLLVAGLSALSLNAFAFKPCEELKNEIADKLDTKGITNYTLTIVENANVGDQKVVGSCNGGAAKITYVRGDATVTSATQEAPAEALPVESIETPAAE